MIYTSYFGNLKKLPKDFVPIAICGKSPDFYKGLEYKKLAPSWSIYSEYKRTLDMNTYIKRFKEERLAFLLPQYVVQDIETLAEGKTAVLLCYEKPTDFCHRHIVSAWLHQNGFECREFM